MGVFTIISALLPFVVGELEQYKVINPGLGNLIQGVAGAAGAFATEITANTGAASITATSLLSAISAALTILQTQTTVSPVTLSIINALDKAIAAGLAASHVTSVDPTALKPMTAV